MNPLEEKNKSIINLNTLQFKMKTQLTANIFRDYFGGCWNGKIIKNGQFQREIEFNWPNAFEKFSSIGIEEGLKALPGSGFFDDTCKVCIAGWQHETKRWVCSWFNKFGGYGEIQWRSQDIVNDVKVLYGIMHECKQESEMPTEHIILCEMINLNTFKFTINSFEKGVIEIEANRLKTAEALRAEMKDQVII